MDFVYITDSNYTYPTGNDILSQNNVVYKMISEALYHLGYDAENFGKESWNPLKEIINEGETVLIKPNLVMHSNPIGGLECMVTHPSVIFAVLEYVFKALNNTGVVIIGDAPVQTCDFDELMDKGGYRIIQDYYKSIGKEIIFYDFRNTVTRQSGDGVYIQEKNDNISFSSKCVDLGMESAFCELESKDLDKLRITNYTSDVLMTHHNKERQEYLITDALLKADVIINIPKPKSHRKAGVTGALKNMVGINSSKEYLPHHRIGSKEEGGDEYQYTDVIKSLRTGLQEKINVCNANGNYIKSKLLHYVSILLYQIQKLRKEKDKYGEGSWYGNDTIWRMIKDITRIVFFADKNGIVQKDKQRRMLVIADMIVCGQKEGPLIPSSYPMNGILVGTNPVVVDNVILKLFGLEKKYFPSIYKQSDLLNEEIIRGKVKNKDMIMNLSLRELPISEKRIQLSDGWKNSAIYDIKNEV